MDREPINIGQEILHPEIAKELLEMREVDQAMRIKNLEDDSWDVNIDRRNTDRMKEIIAEIGWPTISKVGEEASHAAWLLVQHADHDTGFQQACLELMKDLSPEDVNKRNFAYLTDRVRVHSGLPQVYGTQFKEVDDKFVPEEIEDAENLAQRRMEVGLDTLEENILRMNEKYGP